MAGNFCGVLIFVIFVVDLAVMIIATHKKSMTHTRMCGVHAHARSGGGRGHLHPVTKIKTTKINSGSYFHLFTKIGTPKNYLPYGI